MQRRTSSRVSSQMSLRPDPVSIGPHAAAVRKRRRSQPGLRSRAWTVAPARQFHQADIHHDAMQPCPEVGRAFERSDRLDGGEETLLDGVVAVGFGLQKSPGRRQRSGAKPPHELFACVPFSPFDRRRQLQVVEIRRSWRADSLLMGTTKLPGSRSAAGARRRRRSTNRLSPPVEPGLEQLDPRPVGESQRRQIESGKRRGGSLAKQLPNFIHPRPQQLALQCDDCSFARGHSLRDSQHGLYSHSGEVRPPECEGRTTCCIQATRPPRKSLGANQLRGSIRSATLSLAGPGAREISWAHELSRARPME